MKIHRELPVIDILPPSPNFHRRVHLRNQEAVKDHIKDEKRDLKEFTLKKTLEQIHYQREIQKDVAEKYRQLNII